MPALNPLRLVAIAPDLSTADAADDAALAQIERSRQLRIGLLENGYNLIAVLPSDTFLQERLTLNQNGQAITLSKKLADQGAVDGASLAKLMAKEKRPTGQEYTFAQTFPTGTHAMWLYYWMAAHGINPMNDAKVITVPPPQMVANMRVGNTDGFCVGEPWNHRAIIDGIGVTAITTQDIWKDHPEKVLGTTAEFTKKYPNTARAVTAAILEAGKWIDASLSNKNKMVETITDKSYVNTSVDAINQRILGRYQNGMGKTWDDPNYMKFSGDGAVNFPYGYNAAPKTAL